MSCKLSQQKIERYFDEELTLSEKRDMDKHIEHCNSCASLLQGLHTTRKSLLQLESHDASSSLKRRIRQQLPSAVTQEKQRIWPWMGLGSAVTAALFISVWMLPGFIAPTPISITEDNTLNAHVRSLIVDHALDIASTDQHTVKPWFKGKLNFAPPVKQLEKQGFPLTGGRLDYIQQQTLAALVYQRRAHIINLFVGLAHEDDNDPDLSGLISRRGYNLLSWRDRGLQFWLVSDLNKKELLTMAQLLNPAPVSSTNNKSSG